MHCGYKKFSGFFTVKTFAVCFSMMCKMFLKILVFYLAVTEQQLLTFSKNFKPVFDLI